MDDKLTTKKYWSQFWQGISLPIITTLSPDIQKELYRYLPQSKDISLIEIGCAPGGLMAYFHRYFGYSVTGIDYVDDAVALTQQNMKMQQITADVINMDFLEADLNASSYDVVFSRGFIEHFKDPISVVNKMSYIAKKYVVTIVPNIYGLNGFISKTIRPDVYCGHTKISKEFLQSLHEESGLKTLFCDYTSVLQFILPATKTSFFDKNKRLAKIINLPFIAFNFASKNICKYTNLCIRTKFLSKSLMYIGEKA